MQRRPFLIRMAASALALPALSVPILIAPQPARAATGDLAAALAATPPGAILSLPRGDWGDLRLSGAGGPSVIRSQDPSNPARLTGMQLGSVTDLTLENLDLKYTWTAEDPTSKIINPLSKCERVTLRGLRITGDRARGGKDFEIGFGWAIGLGVRACKDVTVEGCEISRFHRGMMVRNCDRIKVRDNHIHGIRMDGMTFTSTQDLVVENNRIRNFERSIHSGDHADMIQFWTQGSTRPSRDVLIRNNLMDSGAGYYTQTIFMRNEEVDQGRAGSEMFYRDITIEDNMIINAHLHGISLGETNGLTIRRNTLAFNPNSPGPDKRPGHVVWLPRINVKDASRNVTVTDNIAAGFPDVQPGWRVANNLSVQPHHRLEPGHYATVFAGYAGGDPTDPATYRPLPGSRADRAGLGAPQPFGR
jgi:polygalacturonase